MKFKYKKAVIDTTGLPMWLLRRKQEVGSTETFYIEEPFEYLWDTCRTIECANDSRYPPEKGYIYLCQIGEYIHIHSLPVFHILDKHGRRIIP